MIVRIFRGCMQPQDEAGIYRDFRITLAQGSRPEGLLDLIFARGVGQDGRMQFVSITLWTDEAAVAAALGPDWRRPFGLPGFEGRIVDTNVEHLEVFADDWPELMSLFARWPARPEALLPVQRGQEGEGRERLGVAVGEDIR